MIYLLTIIDLADDIKNYFKKDEAKLSVDIQKKKNETKNKKAIEKYLSLKKELTEENIPLLIWVLKRLSNIPDNDFNDFLTDVLSKMDKVLSEKLIELEQSYQKSFSESGMELPESLLRDFPTAFNAKAGFNHKFFWEILPLVRLVKFFEKTGNPEVHAYKLCGLFDNVLELIGYLRSFAKFHKEAERILHDACLFDLPCDNPSWKPTLWKNFAKQHLILNGENGDKFKRLLPFAGKIEKCRPSISEQTTIFELDDIYAQLQYERSNENPEAAKHFHKCGIPEQGFNKYLDQVLPKVKDSIRIPDVPILSIQDKKLKVSYYLKKLTPHSPMAPLLGRKTYCCQYIGGAGESCAIHGVTSEEGGFYVVYEGDSKKPSPDDEIVAQCWAWRSKNQALIFDSIEFSKNIQDKIKRQPISTLYLNLANTLVSNPNYGIYLVAVGTSGETPNDFGINGVGQFYVCEEPIDYEDYRDSHTQRILSIKDFSLFLDISVNANELLLHAKFKHWVQSCINSNRKDILDAFKGSISEDKSKEIKETDEVINVSEYLHSECLKEIKDIDWDRLDKLSSKGYCIDLPNSVGSTLLRRVIFKNDLLRIKWLLERGTEIDKLKNYIKSMVDSPNINLTIHNLSPELFEFFLENKFIDIQELRLRSVDLYPMLIKAAEAKQWGLVRTLVENGVSTEAHANYYWKWKSVLSVAVNQKNLGETEWILSKGTTVRYEDLNTAAEKDSWEIFECLAEKSSDPNGALLLASTYEKWDLVRKYVEKGSKSIEDLGGKSSLNIAAEKQQWDIVMLFIEKKAFEGSFALSDALYFALKSQEWDMTRWLILKGADCELAMLYLAEKKEWSKVKELILIFDGNINACYTERNGRCYPEVNGLNDSTVLMKACAQENIVIIDWLLKHKAKLSVKNICGVACFYRAIQDSKSKVIEFLSLKHAGDIQEDLLFTLIQEVDKLRNVKQRSYQPSIQPNPLDWRFFLKLLRNVNAIDPRSGQTVLTAACTQPEPSWELIEELVINRNANLNSKNERGDTALLCLCYNNSISVEELQWLVENGANIHAKNKKEESSVCASLSSSPNFEVASWLIEHGVDNYNSVYHNSMIYGDGDTILLKACYRGEELIAKDLVAKGANIRYKNSQNENAVIIAVKGNCGLKILEWLVLGQQLDIDDKNNAGQTALLIAASRGRWSEVRLLIKLGASINTHATREVEKSRFHFFLEMEDESDLPEEKKYVTDTVLEYAVNEYHNKERWETVAFLLKQPKIDLAEDGVNRKALKQIDESAPDHIKKLLKERREIALTPQILMFSTQGQDVMLQRLERIISENNASEAVNKLNL